MGECIWNRIQSREKPFPDEVTFDSCLSILEGLYNDFGWSEKESIGRTPLIKEKSRLYLAKLMYV